MQKLLQYVKGDKVIWIIALLFSALSLLAVYSAVSSLVWGGEGSSISHLVKHGFMLFFGFVVMFLIHLMPLNYISRGAQLAIWIAVLLLVMTLMFGSNINNADRWLKIPGIGLTIQTSDFAKLVLLTYIARQLTVKRKELKDFRKGVLPIVFPIAVVCLLILPANFSTAALLGFVCFIILAVGGVPWKHLFKLAAFVLSFMVLVIVLGEFGPDKLLPRYDTWKNRIFKKEADAGKIDDSDYQIELAKFAIHEGGVIPKGPGSGSSRNFLPHPYSDMIFAFVIEEYGSIIGGFCLIFLYVIFLFRVIRTSVRSPKQFGALAALGLGLMITVQAFVNMLVAVDLIPTTGQPLPMVSMGGTSILFTFMMFGIILAISKLEKEKEETEIFE
ncbi:MAG: cell division protein FtsW [Bacteroidetes bacterium]|nr:cell division protein FtsW [Bacteroidota bacterium]